MNTGIAPCPSRLMHPHSASTSLFLFREAELRSRGCLPYQFHPSDFGESQVLIAVTSTTSKEFPYQCCYCSNEFWLVPNYLRAVYTDLVKVLLSEEIWNMSSKTRTSSLFSKRVCRYLVSPLDLFLNAFSFSPPKYNKYCGKVKVRSRWIP